MTRICSGACRGIIDTKDKSKYKVIQKKQRNRYYCNSCYKVKQENEFKEWLKVNG